MLKVKNVFSRENLNYVVMLALGAGVAAAVSVGATSIGTDISVDGTLTTTGASTFTGAITANGSVTLGNAAADTLTVNATSTFATGVTISAGGLSITAGGLTVANDGTVSGGLGVGTTATSTAGAIQASGPVQIGGIVSVSQSGTSTISINSTTAARGACLEFESASGAATFRLYATTTGPAIFESGTCR